MSRRQDIQSAEGIALRYPRYGTLQYISKSAPVGGETGFAPGCEWFVPTGTGALNTGLMYTNIGSNGFGSNATATWLESDVTSGSQFQMGGSTATMLSAGTLFRDVQAIAGYSPSATAADKIMAAYTLPASFFDKAGRGLTVQVWGLGAANNNSRRVKVILGATNTGISNGANVAGQTDGTVTVTSGTAIFDSGALTTAANNATILMSGQLYKRGAAGSNTQQSLQTALVTGTTHSGVTAAVDQTFTESGALLLVVTMSCATTATDLVYQGVIIEGFN